MKSSESVVGGVCALTWLKKVRNIHIISQWQKQREEERTGRWLYKVKITRRNRKEESIISSLRFGYTALNSILNKIRQHQTGKCDQEETVEHVIMKCLMFSERRILVCNLKIIKMKFDFTNMMQRNSYDECIYF